MANLASTYPRGTLFEQYLDDFKTGLSPEEAKDFGATTLAELKLTIAAIQKKQASTRTMQNMARLRGFLEAMEAYGKVIDVFVNVSNFVAFIWVASTFADAFNKLLDAYQKIAENLPLLAQLEVLFEKDPHMESALATVFHDIFVFHHRALKYFKGSVWKQLFHATWKQFDTRFGQLIEQMARHKAMVESQASISEFSNARQFRLQAALEFEKLERQETLWRKSFLAGWLAGCEVRLFQDKGEAARSAHPESGRWLWKKDSFRTWYEQHPAAPPFLWINGIPGAGKTVLASLVIEEAKKLPDTCVLYFYFRQEDSTRDTFVAMARSLISQALQQHEALLPFVYEQATSSSEHILRTNKSSEQVLTTCVKAIGKAVIVLDGLDECSQEELNRIITWTKQYIHESASDPEPSRCILFSQNDNLTGPILSTFPAVTIGVEDTKSDISSFCTDLAKSIELRFSLTSAEAMRVATMTSERAEGMFLFASIVMNNLYDQPSKSAFYWEMDTSVFSKGLNQAYARVMDRVLGDSSVRREEARSLISWIACATRALKWREVQAAVSIDFDRLVVDYNRQHVDSAKAICGALVEELSNGDIVFVHSTVAAYVVNADLVQPRFQNLALASLCLNYLSLPTFDKDISADEMEANILDGSYAFFEYALLSWTKHLVRGLQGSTDPGSQASNQWQEDLESFFDQHWKTPLVKPRVPKRIVAIAKLIDQAKLREQTLLTMSSMETLTSGHVPDTASLETVDLHSFLNRVRQALEKYGRHHTRVKVLTRFYSRNLFKCPRMHCKWFYEGFASEKDRDSHKQKHERSHYCPFENCFMARLGCISERELEEHKAAYHKLSDQDFPSDDEEESQPATIFKCEHCQKVFARAFNLKTHLRTHSHEKDFICSVCQAKFGRKGTLKRHEQTHSGSKDFVCQGVLSDGERWGCGSRYSRADGLTRHFKTPAARAGCIKAVLARKDVFLDGSTTDQNTHSRAEDILRQVLRQDVAPP